MPVQYSIVSYRRVRGHRMGHHEFGKHDESATHARLKGPLPAPPRRARYFYPRRFQSERLERLIESGLLDLPCLDLELTLDFGVGRECRIV